MVLAGSSRSSGVGLGVPDTNKHVNCDLCTATHQLEKYPPLARKARVKKRCGGGIPSYMSIEAGQIAS